MENEITSNNNEISIDKLYASIEAILFAAGESVNFPKLSAILEVPMWQLLNIMRDLKEKYNTEHSGVQVVLYEQSAQLCTKSEYAPIIRLALADKVRGQLSKAAYEVLSIIAYKQPTTKAYIEQVRGIESSNTVNILCEKNLIECCGRLDVPGKPFTYRTTDNFLRCFGISSVDELPPLESFFQDEEDEEILGGLKQDNSPKILEIEDENFKEEHNEQTE